MEESFNQGVIGWITKTKTYVLYVASPARGDRSTEIVSPMTKDLIEQLRRSIKTHEEWGYTIRAAHAKALIRALEAFEKIINKKTDTSGAHSMRCQTTAINAVVDIQNLIGAKK